MLTFKLILLGIMACLAGVIFVVPLFFTNKKGKNNAGQSRTMVRIRMGCFLAMLILLLICVIF